MKSRVVAGVALASWLFAAAAAAECKYPKAPTNIPDGRTATEAEMVEGMRAVKQYQADVDAYLKCLDSEAQASISAAGPDASQDQIVQIKEIQNKRHNAAVEELEAHAARFNEQVRAFKNREKKS